LTAEERKTLQAWQRAGSTEQRLVDRARIILRAAQGQGTEEIAAALDTRPARVSKWRRRFARQRLPGLVDAPRAGPPRRYDARTERRILAGLDQRPPEGHATWTGTLLAEAVGDVTPQQVWRVLRRHGISLRRRRSWCISTDPEFVPKAADVVGLYLHPPEHAVVLAVDEKPQIQALERAQGWLRLPSGAAVTGFAHGYTRHGTTTLFAALEVATGFITARHYWRRRRRQFLDFMNTAGRALRRLGAACHSRQPQYAQADARSLAPSPSERPLPLHSNLQLVAEPGRGLVQHPDPPGARGG